MSSTQSIVSNGSKSFVDYFKKELIHLDMRRKFGSLKRYKTTFYHLIKYLDKKNRTNLLFSDITVEFITEFETYLLSRVKENTTKNYINCIRKLYNQSIRTDHFVSHIDPFKLYVNNRKPVEKKYLSNEEVTRIIETEIDDTNILSDVRNLFLFQIFAQGLRVRDLLTIRWGNIRDGRLNLNQTKTRKRHSILLNDNMLSILSKYISTNEEENERKHRFMPTLGSQVELTLRELKVSHQQLTLRMEEIQDIRTSQITQTSTYCKFFSPQLLSVGHIDMTNHRRTLKRGKKVGLLTEDLDYYLSVLSEDLKKIEKILEKNEKKRRVGILLKIMEHSRYHHQKFIFPILEDSMFSTVKFDEDMNMSISQYRLIDSKITLYNRRLKKLQQVCEIDQKLTSHLARHTYTNLMLSVNSDVYEISKSLGHQRLSTTEHYLNEFLISKVDEPNIVLNKMFSV
jgi:integrase